MSKIFKIKAMFVADGHLFETPASITYSAVVSRDSVRILILVAALNNLKTMVADVNHDFLSAEILEKYWIKDSPYLELNKGKYLLL